MTRLQGTTGVGCHHGVTVRLILPGPGGGGGGGGGTPDAAAVNALQMVSDLNSNGGNAVSSNSAILSEDHILYEQVNLTFKKSSIKVILLLYLTSVSVSELLVRSLINKEWQ